SCPGCSTSIRRFPLCYHKASGFWRWSLPRGIAVNKHVCAGAAISLAVLNLKLGNFSAKPLSNEDKEVLMRATKGFTQLDYPKPYQLTYKDYKSDSFQGYKSIVNSVQPIRQHHAQRLRSPAPRYNTSTISDFTRRVSPPYQVRHS